MLDMEMCKGKVIVIQELESRKERLEGIMAQRSYFHPDYATLTYMLNEVLLDIVRFKGNTT